MNATLRHSLALLLLPLLLPLLTACIAEDGDPQPEINPDGSVTIGYLSVSLRRADGETRAPGDLFDYGQTEEFLIAPGEHHFVVFYGEKKDAPRAVAAITGIVDRETTDLTANSTVAFAALAARNEQKEVLLELQEAFVVLNADFDMEELWKVSREQLLQTVVYSPFIYDSKGYRYFTMANAVSVKNGQKSIAATVDTSKIYSSRLEAIEMAWKGEAAVDVYVERIAAKISLGLARGGDERVFTPKDNKIILFEHLDDGIAHYEEGYSCQYRITGWGMNALEPRSWLFRDVNPSANYFSGWSNPAYERVFWSEDCNYAFRPYPWQFRRAVNYPDIPWYGAGNAVLINRSYDDLAAGGFNYGVEYIPENTWDFADPAFRAQLDNRPEILAGTHVIVCAELLTNLKGPYEPNDVYRDRNGNFYRTEFECIQALVASMNNGLRAHRFLKFTDYSWSGSGKSGTTLYANTHGEYALWYNGTKLTPENVDRLAGTLTTVPATVKNGDGQRLIWMDGLTIRDDAGNQLAIYSNIDEVDSSKDRFERWATTDDIRSLLFEYTGVIDHFADGKMYYAVPVGYVRDDNASTDARDAYSIYGVVRNSVYRIVINDVTGIGTSVDEPGEPIIPNQVSTHDKLFLNIHILHWHDTEQNVPGVIT